VPPEVQRADAGARRRAVLLVVAGAVVGALLIAASERARGPLRDWILSEPGESARRLRLVVLLSGGVLLAPLFGFAAYLWTLGSRVLRAGRFPPPGCRVIRDTPVHRGRPAVSRGRGLQALAVGLGVAAALLGSMWWRLASMLGGSGG
jgi:hypothetical protein